MSYERRQTPRCGKSMTWIKVHGREPRPGGTACGRPVNHRGECKSVEALERKRDTLNRQRRDRYALLRTAGFSHPEAQYACASAARFNRALQATAA